MTTIEEKNQLDSTEKNQLDSTIKKKYQLDTFQLEACDHMDNGFHILVSAPTGSGKTAIAEYAIEITKLKNKSTQIIYTCPIKSLCNEKYRDMVNYHQSISSGYSIGLMTGDIIINPTGDIVIMTTEVLYNLSTNKEKEAEFNPGCVIFDEVHYINDDGRGHIWEKCIIYSLQKYSALLVLLSATIGNIDQLITWLNSISPPKEFKSIIKTDRPVPLREYFIDNYKIRLLKKKSIIENEEDKDKEKDKQVVTDDPAPEQYELLPINNLNYDKVKKYWDKLEEYEYSVDFELKTLCNQIASNPNLGIPAIIFVLSKTKCIRFAEMIESNYVSYQEQVQILRFYDENLKEFETNSQYIDLRKTIAKGIAYHHSGLIPKIREVVEFLIKNKLIKIVFATETFAVGLNFPVKTVVLTALNKPTENGFRALHVSEYKQMAGRAGRRFLDAYGNVILWLYNDRLKTKFPYPSWKEIQNITAGPVNNIESKFVIEPNFLLKNLETFQNIASNSFRYYNSNRKPNVLAVPERFVKLLDGDKKALEYANKGITYIDKNYSKLFNKLSKTEQVEYKQFYEKFKASLSKSDYENYLDKEDSLLNFIFTNNFIEKTTNGWVLSTKGELACNFNEINPVIFIEDMERILKYQNNILPLLSMFIDDGYQDKDKDNDFVVPADEPDLIYFDTLVKNKYASFTNILPKWTFYPYNYLILKRWLEDKDISLDHISQEFGIDQGLMVKILIKMYQITDELVSKLVKINRTDLTDFLVGQKDLLIRYPIQISSLYVNN
jgi:superfamily II RNA helicase